MLTIDIVFGIIVHMWHDGLKQRRLTRRWLSNDLCLTHPLSLTNGFTP